MSLQLRHAARLPLLIRAVLLIWGALLSAVSTSAAADLPEYWYTRLGIGWAYPNDMDFDDSSSSLDFDIGRPLFSIAAGAGIGERWRFELEASERRNDLEVLRLTETGIAIDPASSDRLDAYSILFNAIHQFEMGTALRPYLGLGVGAANARLRLHESAIQGVSFTRPPRLILDDETWAFAYQFIAGLQVPLSSRWELGIEYHFWQMPSLELSTEAGDRLDLEHSVHSVWLQAGYRFSDRGASIRIPRSSDRGWYLASGAGTTYNIDTEIADSLANFDAWDMGTFFALAAGYETDGAWRFELEWTRRENDAEIIDFNPQFGERVAKGGVRTDSLMINAIHTFQRQQAVRPYLGVGLGAVHARFDVDVPAGSFAEGNPDGVALQVIAGVEFELTPRLTLSADYRPWITSQMKFRLADGEQGKAFLLSHSMALGLRYALQ